MPVVLLSGEGEERQLAENLVEVLLFQKFQKDDREQIFLEPSPAARLTRQKIRYIVIECKYSVHSRCKRDNMNETEYELFLYG